MCTMKSKISKHIGRMIGSISLFTFKFSVAATTNCFTKFHEKYLTSKIFYVLLLANYIYYKVGWGTMHSGHSRAKWVKYSFMPVL